MANMNIKARIIRTLLVSVIIFGFIYGLGRLVYDLVSTDYSPVKTKVYPPAEQPIMIIET